MSFLSTAICLGAAFAVSQASQITYMSWLILTLIPGCAIFCIHGYVVTPEVILVQRLFWDTRLPRSGLLSAVFEPNAMKESIRTFGNGGFFSFSGFYRNQALGSYSAFVTDFDQTVVLRYSSRTIVISPETPDEFVKIVTLLNGS